MAESNCIINDKDEKIDVMEHSKRNPKIFPIIVILFILTAIIWAAIFYVFVLYPDSDEYKEVLSTVNPHHETLPNETVNFSFSVYNPSRISDIYNSSVSGIPEDWITFVPDPFSVSSKNKRLDFIGVKPILPSALNGTYSFILNITSENTNLNYSLELSLTIRQTFGIEMLCYNNTHSSEPGRNTYYAVALKNFGNGYDNVSLSHDFLPKDWNIIYENNTVVIPHYSSSVVIINLSIDSNTSIGEYSFMLKALSQGGMDELLWINTIISNDFSNETIKIGDMIQTDYIGINTDGNIFDTSLHGIALNETLPKSNNFALRPQYIPISIVVGDNDPIPNDVYFRVIEGYWKAVVGLKVNETMIVRIPPERAYMDGRTMVFEITVVSIDS